MIKIDDFKAKETINVPQEVIYTIDGLTKEIADIDAGIASNETQITFLQGLRDEKEAKLTQLQTLGIISEQEVPEE